MIKKWNEFLVESHKYEFGCVMIKVPIKNWENITNMIDESDIYEGEEDDTYGIQRNPHVTLLYGLRDDISIDQVKDKLSGYGPVRIELNGIEIFDENEKFDVVKFGVVKTDQLKNMFQSLSELPNENKFPDYRPHITISYVKKGRGEKYIKHIKKNLGNMDIIEFSNSKGKKEFKLSDLS